MSKYEETNKIKTTFGMVEKKTFYLIYLHHLIKKNEQYCLIKLIKLFISLFLHYNKPLSTYQSYFFFLYILKYFMEKTYLPSWHLLSIYIHSPFPSFFCLEYYKYLFKYCQSFFFKKDFPC